MDSGFTLLGVRYPFEVRMVSGEAKCFVNNKPDTEFIGWLRKENMINELEYLAKGQFNSLLSILIANNNNLIMADEQRKSKLN